MDTELLETFKKVNIYSRNKKALTDLYKTESSMFCPILIREIIKLGRQSDCRFSDLMSFNIIKMVNFLKCYSEEMDSVTVKQYERLYKSSSRLQTQHTWKPTNCYKKTNEQDSMIAMEYTGSNATHATNGISDRLDAALLQDTKNIYVT
jgi:hypothetical protein